MQEFKVNDYITLKLEDGKTNIYIKGKLFRQCKYLLLEIPVNEITSINEIESIDEAAKRLGHSLENELNPELAIPPEVEFWGHCSNLQVWYENEYNPRLLHSNLSFPLLQKLSDIDDPLAIQILKEDLTKRLIAGSYSVMDLLINKDYFDYFSRDELWYVIEELQEGNFEKYLHYISAKYYFLEKLIKMGDDTAKEIFKKGIIKSLSCGYNPIVSYFYEMGYINYISRDEFWGVFGANGKILQKIEQQVRKYKLIDGNKVYQENLDNLEYFKLSDEISMDAGFMIFTLEDKTVSGIGLFGDESSVAEQNHDYYYEDLGFLELEKLPDSIEKLKSIKVLILRDIGLKRLPNSIISLNNLKTLSLTGNPQLKLPASLWDLKSLERLDLSNINLTKLSTSIENLENIKELSIYSNNLKTLPLSSIEKLKNLQRIDIDIELADTLDDEIYKKIKNILSIS